MLPFGGGGGGSVGPYIETLTVFYTSASGNRNSLKVLTADTVSDEFYRHDGGTIYEDSYVKVDYRGDHEYPYMWVNLKQDLYVMRLSMNRKNDRRPILYSAGSTIDMDPPHDVSDGLALFEV